MSCLVSTLSSLLLSLSKSPQFGYDCASNAKGEDRAKAEILASRPPKTFDSSAALLNFSAFTPWYPVRPVVCVVLYVTRPWSPVGRWCL